MVTKRPRMNQIDDVVRQVFYEGQTVRSRYHGLGEVTMSGEDPRVRFLGEWESGVPGDTLTVVPGEVYDAEVENRHNWERFLDLFLHGRTEKSAKLLAEGEGLGGKLRSATEYVTGEQQQDTNRAHVTALKKHPPGLESIATASGPSICPSFVDEPYGINHRNNR